MNTPTTTPTTKPTKEQLLNALKNWVKQRPGLDFANYGDVSAYRSELRTITRQRHDAETLIREVALRDTITTDDILSNLSNRLTWNAEKSRLEYCTGQYWCTEYRAAVCSVLASVLWSYFRFHAMPSPIKNSEGYDLYNGKNAGDWLRSNFRKELGRGIASRWFN